MIPHAALSEPFPMSRADLDALDMGEPIGIRPIREATTDGYCYCDALAPGSSPHRHTVITAWEVVCTDGILTVDRDGMGVRASSLYDLPTE